PGPLTQPGFVQIDNNPAFPVFDPMETSLNWVGDVERIHLRFSQEPAPGHSLVLTVSNAAKLVGTV
ncbi:MAG: hypothetical protein NUW37_14730, partial [Planctomycetes bacterium]|nr:hypothetical protein [Planctomycetota bacterium]